MSTPADYWAQAQIDPAYQATKGGLTKSLIQQILNYGDSSALAPEEASLYGVTPNQTAAADQNPYSTVHQLAQQLSGNQYGITNSANSHGLLDSGAYQAGQQHENQQGAQRSYNALQALQAQISGIDQQNTNALTSAYGTIATNAANTPTAPPAPIPTVAPNSSPGSPGIPTVTATGAQTLPGYQIQGPQNVGTGGMTPIKAPALPKLPSVSAQAKRNAI